MKVRDFLKHFGLATTDGNATLDADMPTLTGTTQTPTVDSAVMIELQKVAAAVATLDTQVKTLVAARTKDEAEASEAEKKAKDEEEEKKKAEDEENEEIAKQEAMDTILEAESPGKVLNLGTVYTGDSAGSKPDAFKEIVARAEILAPGIAIPTKDSLKGTKGTALAKFMRTALEKCATTDSGREALATFVGNTKVADLKGHALLGAFNGAANLVKARNNNGVQRAAGAVKTTDFGRTKSIAEINQSNKEFWAKQKAR